MKITCNHCGFSGEINLFDHISFSENAQIETKKCPKCGDMVSISMSEVLEERENRARELSAEIEKKVDEGNTILAKQMIKELAMLNRYLNIEGINYFIKQMKKKMAEHESWGR